MPHSALSIYSTPHNKEGPPQARPGKSCESSSIGKFRILKCLLNTVICEKGQREICVLNVGVARWNPQILIAYPQSIALNPISGVFIKLL